VDTQRAGRVTWDFFGKRRQTVKVLWWDGTGTVLWYKKLDVGMFEITRAVTP
jgi:transposase